jgi:hypothetical protein
MIAFGAQADHRGVLAVCRWSASRRTGGASPPHRAAGRRSGRARPARHRHPRRDLPGRASPRPAASPARYPARPGRRPRTGRRLLAAPHVHPAVTVRDGIRGIVGSDFGRHDEHRGVSMSVAWMPIGRACQQLAFTVSDVRRSQRNSRRSGSVARASCCGSGRQVTSRR